MRSQKIGLLGGSFNPAHAGHFQISETALRSLGLDQIWWLVSPQNPLKSDKDMADFDDRIASAKKAARSPKIVISDFEKRLGQTFTANTIKALKHKYPRHDFVWLMGADNLVQIPKWHRWRDIFAQIPVAVFDRPGFTYRALSSKAAQIFAASRVFMPASGRPALDFAGQNAPKWIFIPHTKYKMSSTSIRNSCDIAGNACSSARKFPN